MKENGNTQSNESGHFRLSDPSRPGWGLSALPGQVVGLGVGRNPKHFAGLRYQIIRQLRLQQSIFDEDSRRYWHYSLLDTAQGQPPGVKIDGMRFIRLIAHVNGYVESARRRIAGFGARTIGAVAGLDCRLAPIIAQYSIPLCPNCAERMNRSDPSSIARSLRLAHKGETLIIVGQVRAAPNSSLSLGQLIEMTEVERVVIGDRLFTHEEIGSDIEYSPSDKVADFGNKLPNLFVVLDSVSLSSDAAQLQLLETLISNAERRWGKPIWILKISTPTKTVTNQVVVSSGFVCPACEEFAQPLSIQALELEDRAILCQQCEGRGYIFADKCSACLGVGLIQEWTRASLFGVELHELGQRSPKDLKLILEESDLPASTVESSISLLQVLDKLGFGDYRIGDNCQFFSCGEKVRWALLEQFAYSLSDATIIFDLALDVFDQREVKELLGVLRELAGDGNCCLVMTARTNVLTECDVAADFDINETPASYSATWTDPNQIQNLNLINIQAGAWIAEKLSLPTNGLFCVSGSSGSGKTTLLRDVLGDLFKRGGPKLSLVSPSSPISQESFSHFEYLDVFGAQGQQACGPLESLASLSGLDSLLAKHFCLTKEARLKGFLAKDFSLRQSRRKCKKCRGLGAILDGMFFDNYDYQLMGGEQPCQDCRGVGLSEEILEVNWNSLGFGGLLAGSWTELEAQSFGDASIIQTCRNFIQFGFGPSSVGGACADLCPVDKIKAWFASSFSRRGLAFNNRPGAMFALDYPFIGLTRSEIVDLFAIMRELTDLGHTIYSVDNNPELSPLFDQTVQIESFLSGDCSRRSRIV